MKYGWTAHDGRNFGIHDVYESVENGFSIRTSWAKRNGGKHGGDWSARTTVTPFTNEQNPKFVSVVFYFATEYTGWIKSIKRLSHSSILIGETRDVGGFKVKIEGQTVGETNKNNKIFIDQATGNISVVHLKESLIQDGFFARINIKQQNLKEYIGLKPGNDRNYEESNFIAYQISGFAPFQFEVIFESDSLRKELEEKNQALPNELKGAEFDSVVADYYNKFSNKFESIFQLKEKNFSSSAIFMAQSALSNMLGGIGFFSGRALVKSINNKEPVYYWPANLYTAVPSRSFFPRGFLWDEGI
jgi:mannosyl-oligosaccharide glucosidase